MIFLFFSHPVFSYVNPTLSASNFVDKIYISRPTQGGSSDSEINVKNSFFVDCINRKDNGGAIFINSPLTSLNGMKSTFINCSATGNESYGGSIYFSGSKAKIYQFFAINCQATKSGQTFYFKSNSTNISLTTIERSPEEVSISYSDSLYILNGINYFESMNISSNNFGKQPSVMSSYSCYLKIKSSLFSNNIGMRIASHLYSNTTILLCQYINNTATSKNHGIILYSDNIHVSKCCFYQNKGILFSQYKGKHAILTDSYLDTDEIGSINGTKNRKYNSSINYTLDLYNLSIENITNKIKKIRLALKNTNVSEIPKENSEKDKEIMKPSIDATDNIIPERKEESKTIKTHIVTKIPTETPKPLACPKPNMMLNGNECVCKPGYQGDKEQGCWKCGLCHQSANCVSPGVCKCIEGLIGDGVRQCNFPIPKIKDITPDQITTEVAEVLVNLDQDSKYFAAQVYCRFNNKYTVGTMLDQRTIACDTPEDLSDKHTLISVSFDNMTWSKENIILEKTDAFEEIRRKMPWGLIIFIISMAILIYLLFILVDKYLPNLFARFDAAAEEKVAFLPNKA